jgi:FixJ family two-component response regulator
MDTADEVIIIIDDDKSVRRSLSLFLTANGYTVESYSSSEEYLAHEAWQGRGCLLLDVNLEGKSGLELQEVLLKMNSYLPIIFMTGLGNIQMSVKAIKNGAVNFLEKPFKDEELLHSVEEALVLCSLLKTEKEETALALQLVAKLTSRETEILTYIINGMLNKQIAYELNIAEQTVKLHRRSICDKLGVKSVPEIIRISDKAGIIPAMNNY